MISKRQDAVNDAVERVRRSPEGDAFTALVMQVVRLSYLISAKGEALARPAGQTLARWITLSALADAPATVAQISRRFGYARQSVQRLADLLVVDGLAEYQDNPGHARSKLVRITPRGREVLRAIDLDQKAWSDQLGASITSSDLERASDVLDHVIDAMSEPEVRPGERRGRRTEEA